MGQFTTKLVTNIMHLRYKSSLKNHLQIHSLKKRQTYATTTLIVTIEFRTCSMYMYYTYIKPTLITISVHVHVY